MLIANYAEHEHEHAEEALMVHIYASWNALIVGYAEQEPFSKVLKCI